MSKRPELKRRVHTISEIKSILGAMKSLSIIEMNKVSRYLGAQTEFALTIEETLADFERFFKVAGDLSNYSVEKLFVLLGSERGFCGGFNEDVLAHFAEISTDVPHPQKIIVVGRKLASKLDGDPRIVETLDGPNAAEEITATITELARRLTRFPNVRWTLVYHEDSDTHTKVAAVCPFTPRPTRHSCTQKFPPLLNLSPELLYPQLFEQHLFSVLYRSFYLSFLAENRDRLRHMEGALRELDKKWNQMRKLSNVLWQEEITEELEVIMLSVNA